MSPVPPRKQGSGGSAILGGAATDSALDEPELPGGAYLLRFVMSPGGKPRLELADVDSPDAGMPLDTEKLSQPLGGHTFGPYVPDSRCSWVQLHFRFLRAEAGLRVSILGADPAGYERRPYAGGRSQRRVGTGDNTHPKAVSSPHIPTTKNGLANSEPVSLWVIHFFDVELGGRWALPSRPGREDKQDGSGAPSQFLQHDYGALRRGD